MGDAAIRGLKSADVEMADAECKAGVTLNVGLKSKDLDLLLNALIWAPDLAAAGLFEAFLENVSQARGASSVWFLECPSRSGELTA